MDDEPEISFRIQLTGWQVVVIVVALIAAATLVALEAMR